MNCPTCDEHVDMNVETATCDWCVHDAHPACIIKRADPVDEYLADTDPVPSPEPADEHTEKVQTPKPVEYDWCYACYAARAHVVRMAMIGEAHPELRSEVDEAWGKYQSILDRWSILAS